MHREDAKERMTTKTIYYYRTATSFIKSPKSCLRRTIVANIPPKIIICVILSFNIECYRFGDNIGYEPIRIKQYDHIEVQIVWSNTSDEISLLLNYEVCYPVIIRRYNYTPKCTSRTAYQVCPDIVAHQKCLLARAVQK